MQFISHGSAQVSFRQIIASMMFSLVLLGSASSVQAFDFGKSATAGAMGEFLPVDEALPFASGLSEDGVSLSWNIAPEHYLYRGRISVKADDDRVTISEPVFSQPGHDKQDPYFGEVVVFTEPVSADVSITLPEGMKEANLKVTYQGCADAGLCYPPQTRDVLYISNATSTPAAPDNTISPASTPIAAATAAVAIESPVNTDSATGIAGILANQSTAVIIGLFLLLGLGLTFTPCVLPMIPIISTLVSSRTTSSTAQALMLSVSYVVGMALTYAAAGVITGMLGASFNLQAHLQSPVVLSVFAALFILFALSMFGMFDIQLPAFLRDRLNNASQRMSGGKVASVFGIGALSALIVSPCVSAPLAGSLIYISTTQDAVLGGAALFALGLGMGIPLILVAVGGRRLLPTAGAWMNTVKAVYGVMLLAVSIWLLERLVPGWASMVLWGLLAAVTGVQLGAFESARAGWQRTWKGLGLVLFAYALALLGGAMTGATDPLRPLEPLVTGAGSGNAGNAATAGHAETGFVQVAEPAELRTLMAAAANSGKPVMLDFYADWCISCKVMERNVFSRPSVQSALRGFTLLQIDVTDNSPAQQALLDELGLFGPPAILFYDASGNELKPARVMGEMDREQFLAHINGLPDTITSSL
ncbi:MAG: thiol:disulfide interchange protein [Alteromonadaceae bacterium]|nr:thiol:disulfide interchange protein [Alteromonadaceae bacterium]MBH85583.1 thiol:disulfide interchange protein [Alteromonadaceae bacterium]|tara:strand:+ start:26741 stop:28678 length:1938 start_codon:yes stop_codon:yes gene_type:complete